MLDNFRAPRFNADGSVDLLCTHAQYGEIAFTASAGDSVALGRSIHARAIAGEFGPIATYVPPTKTPEQIAAELTDAVQRHLDATAKTRGYDHIVSACSYAAAPNPFQAEGIACLNWRSAVWAHCYQVLAAVQAAQRPIPTREELLAELPAMVWP